MSALMPVVGTTTALAAAAVKLAASASYIALTRNTLPLQPVTATRTPLALRESSINAPAQRVRPSHLREIDRALEVGRRVA